MDFRERVPLGRTGMMVSRLGLASGYGVPTAAIEKAFHEYGVNYLYLSMLRRGRMARAICNLAPHHRDDMCIVLAKPFGRLSTEKFVDRWLRKLGIDHIELLILQEQRKVPGPKLTESISRLRESGKVRFICMSSHDRPFVGRMVRGEEEAPVDVFQIRYNAVHTGAEQDICPHLPPDNRPGIVVFTATCWGRLLKPKFMPVGESPPAPADCYRFVLSHPDMDVCVTGPSTAEQMEENLKALDAGPLDEEEMARIRRIGEHIYGINSRGPFLAR